MAESITDPRVDGNIGEAKKWREEFEKLRSILLDFPLTEDLKWGKPCYTFRSGNVAIIHGFKDYCALLFIKGALFADPKGLLIQQTENVQTGRQIRFTNIQEINEREADIKAFIAEAIEAEKTGLKVENKAAELNLPKEFLSKLQEMPDLKSAFATLTPGRQKAYALYFSAPKQSKTRDSRVEKYIPQILEGKGLDD